MLTTGVLMGTAFVLGKFGGFFVLGLVGLVMMILCRVALWRLALACAQVVGVFALILMLVAIGILLSIANATPSRRERDMRESSRLVAPAVPD